LLTRCGGGVAGLALADMAQAASTSNLNPMAPKLPHFAAKAKAVISIFCYGGVSQVDTFDPKPKLAEMHLKEFVREGKQKSAMESGKRYYVQSPFKFAKHGQSGADMAENWEHLAKVADENAMLWIPGCMTPSEVIAAENLGAKMIKLFPGNIIGMAFMQAIKELFPGLLFMPTGGVDVTKENIEGWFKAGVCAVGMGSKLVTKSIMDNRQYDELVAATKDVLAIIRDVKK